MASNFQSFLKVKPFEAAPLKCILLLMLAIVLPACHAEAQLRTDRDKDGLSGQVHTLRVEKIALTLKGGLYQEETREISKAVYDERGNKREELKYKEDGSLMSKNVIEYDAAGDIKAVTIYDSNGSIYLQKKYARLQRDEGRMLEEAVLAKGTTLIAKTTYAYNKRGQGIELTTYDPTGHPEMKQVMTYGRNGKPDEIVYFGKANSRTGNVVFTYDGSGNPMKEEIFDKDGVLNEKLVFKPVSNEKGAVEILKYDGDGNLLTNEVYGREFDTHGNWIKETRSARNTSGELHPIEITRRTITYY